VVNQFVLLHEMRKPEGSREPEARQARRRRIGGGATAVGDASSPPFFSRLFLFFPF